jgi:hypothetical protein
MFQKSSADLLNDPQVQRFLQTLVGERFGPDGPGLEVDFASLERWAHDVGRTVARGLCEQTANPQATDPQQPRPGPDCPRECDGEIDTRELLTRDGPIRLQEIRCPCPHCRRVFFPNRPAPRLTHRAYSPESLTIAIIASTVPCSFEEVARLLKTVGDLSLSPRHLQTLTQEVGDELTAARNQRTESLRKQPFMTPPKQAAPPIPVAAVMADGGRIQTRPPGPGPGVHEPHWRETKRAVLVRMTSVESAVDPHPGLPECFAAARLAPRQAEASAREVGPPGSGVRALCDTPAQGGASVGGIPWTGSQTDGQPKDPTHPQCLLRTGVASLSQSQEFGWMVAAAAEARGFFSASRQAFVGAGQSYTWTIHREPFPTFGAITDFLHVSAHRHEGVAARGQLTGEVPGWGRRWAETCGRGGVDQLLSELGRFRDTMDNPDLQELEADHPLKVVRELRTYRINNRERMDYPRDRREGWPITSSPVESWIKQLNHRVQGGEQFWDDDQESEAVLQVRAAWLGEDEELERSLRERPGHPAARPRQENRTRVAA